MGSLQKFVESYSNCEDMGPTAFPVEEVHKITVLDMRLANADRHGGNILVYKQGDQSSIHLIPNDHGYCLPENVWWRQVAQWSSRVLRTMEVSATIQGVISISGRLDEEIIRRFFLIMDISKHSIDREGKATQKDEDYTYEDNGPSG